MKSVVTGNFILYAAIFYYDFQNQNTFEKNLECTCSKLDRHKYFQTHTAMELKIIIYIHKNNHIHINKNQRKYSYVRVIRKIK